MIAFFRDALGCIYLGNWHERTDNKNIENGLLTDWLKRNGHGDRVIDKVLRELDKAAALGGSKTLYEANREVYDLLRYGVKVRPHVGEPNVTVWLIDWENPGNNDFAIAPVEPPRDTTAYLRFFCAYAEPTDRYGDFHGALRCLIADANLEIPPEPQSDLFEEK